MILRIAFAPKGLLKVSKGSFGLARVLQDSFTQASGHRWTEWYSVFLFILLIFQSLKHEHKKDDENHQRWKELKLSKQSSTLMETDGINNLDYKLNKIVDYEDYVHIFVELLSQ